MSLLDRKIAETLEDLGPGIYTIRVITDAVNGSMRSPRWTTHHIGNALRHFPNAKYLGRHPGHENGKSTWQVVA